MSAISSVPAQTTDQRQTRKRTHAELSQKNPDSLHTLGYKIFRSAVSVPDDIIDEALQKTKKAPAIFNHNGSEKNDNKRRQTTLTASKCRISMKRFLKELNEYAGQNISDTLKPAPWVAIYSKPGCQNQAPHCDYIPDKNLATATDEQMPLAVIVALMDGTRINIWPESIILSSMNDDSLKEVKPINCEVLELKRGDIFVFRGDCVHAGSSYDEENVRLHTYLDSDCVPRTRNRTWTIGEHGSKQLQGIIKQI